MVRISLLLWAGSLSVWLITWSPCHYFSTVMRFLSSPHPCSESLWGVSGLSFTPEHWRVFFSAFPIILLSVHPHLRLCILLPQLDPFCLFHAHHQKQVVNVSTQWPNEGVWVQTDGTKGTDKKKNETEKGEIGRKAWHQEGFSWVKQEVWEPKGQKEQLFQSVTPLSLCFHCVLADVIAFMSGINKLQRFHCSDWRNLSFQFGASDSFNSCYHSLRACSSSVSGRWQVMEYSSKLSPDGYINRTTARPWCPQLSVGYIQSLWDERLCDPGAASDMSHRLTAARWHDQSDSWYWCLVCIYLFSTINHDWLENQQCWNRLVLFPVSMNYYEAPGSPRLFVISVGRSVGSELPQPTQRPELPWRVQHCPEPHRCCWLWQKV